MCSASGLVEFVKGQLERFSRSYEEWSANGDVEAIHDFRVSCRRLNEPLGIMSNWVSPGKVRPSARVLKRLRRALRCVRDYDVLLESLSHGAACTQLSTEGLAQLEGILTSRRARYFKKAAARVGGLKPPRVQRAVEELIPTFEQKVADSERIAVPDFIRKKWRRRAAMVLKEAPLAAEPCNLHPLRIGFKKLRYCTELLYELEQRGQDAFLGRCREVQDRLGAWNDHIFAARLCSRLATRENLLAGQTGWCAAVLDYALSRARAAQSQREELIRFWPIAQSAIQSLLPMDERPSRAAERPCTLSSAPLPSMDESAP